ncbi:R2 Retrovirus-related Pol polyprotein from type I retrotransposable element [Collichthys lucidus]|uniref:R2 Retrovirus-related Pol polyprotein from type I retrotransposable element n=1 Tax=Collichthys lucidus TaxID=240159 RepID=A0A4U5TUV0_COLLU|nr:R2 Retrovirus-related Pol polyprotein from type I retrotransposable element [Collichthys lucidus]
MCSKRVLEGAWEFAQTVYMCIVDLEKVFDRVPRGVLWRVLQEYGVSDPLIRAIRSLYSRCQSLVHIAGSKSDLFPVRVGLRQGCPLSPVLFITFMDRISRRSQGVEGQRFGGLTIGSLLFADDVVLLASSERDLQLSLEQFAAECEVAGMGITTFKSETMVLSRKRVECSLRVGDEILPQVEEFKYLGILFTSEGRMERKIDQRIGAASAVMRTLHRSVVGEKLGHPRGAQSRTAAPPHLEEPVKVARASREDASWTSPWGDVPGTSLREAAPGKTQDTLEGLCLSAGLGTPWGPPGRAGQSGRGDNNQRKVWATLLKLLPPRLDSRISGRR